MSGLALGYQVGWNPYNIKTFKFVKPVNLDNAIITNSTLNNTTFTGTVTGFPVTAVLPLTTKGDILIHNGVQVVRLPVGPDTSIPVAKSPDPEGIVWNTPFFFRAHTAITQNVVNNFPISFVNVSEGNAEGTMTGLGLNTFTAPYTGVFSITFTGSAIWPAEIPAGGTSEAHKVTYSFAFSNANHVSQFSENADIGAALVPIPLRKTSSRTITYLLAQGETLLITAFWETIYEAIFGGEPQPGGGDIEFAELIVYGNPYYR